MDVQRLLAEIEMDVQELKFLLDAFSKNPDEVGRRMVKRDVERVQGRLADLWKEVENCSLAVVPELETADIQSVVDVQVPSEAQPQREEETFVIPLQSSTIILAERIRPAADLNRSISLNDSFRFSRELFDGSTERMNTVLQRISELTSLDEALALLSEEVNVEEENEAFIDLQELLKKFFT